MKKILILILSLLATSAHAIQIKQQAQIIVVGGTGGSGLTSVAVTSPPITGSGTVGNPLNLDPSSVTLQGNLITFVDLSDSTSANAANIIALASDVATSTDSLELLKVDRAGDTMTGTLILPLIDVDSTTINTVPYTWPVVQGSVGTRLNNNGSGALTWVAPTSGQSVIISSIGFIAGGATVGASCLVVAESLTLTCSTCTVVVDASVNASGASNRTNACIRIDGADAPNFTCAATAVATTGCGAHFNSTSDDIAVDCNQTFILAPGSHTFDLTVCNDSVGTFSTRSVNQVKVTNTF